MNTQLILGTDHGVFTLEEEGGSWRESKSAYPQQRFTALASQGEVILAGSRDGLFRSADRGQTWHAASDGLAHRHIRSLSIHPENVNLAYVGTEPASVHYSLDGGQTWQHCPEVTALREHYGWFLPYSPNAGCVRGFALSGPRAYAAVEQGGLLRSDDSGKTWRLMDPREDESLVAPSAVWIHPDVHSVQVHPSSSDTILAPTGGGFYSSTAGGRRWTRLQSNYCRAVWVDPLRVGHMILGPADGPDRNGWIVESLDSGETWERRMQGLESTWSRTMVERFLQKGNALMALLSNGSLITAPLDTLQWRPLLPAYHDVRAVSLLPGEE